MITLKITPFADFECFHQIAKPNTEISIYLRTCGNPIFHDTQIILSSTYFFFGMNDFRHLKASITILLQSVIDIRISEKEDYLPNISGVKPGSHLKYDYNNPEGTSITKEQTVDNRLSRLAPFTETMKRVPKPCEFVKNNRHLQLERLLPIVTLCSMAFIVFSALHSCIF